MTTTKVKIIFFAWESFYGKLIKFHTGSKWTHVGIVGLERAEEYVCFEAINKGLTASVYTKAQIAEWEKLGLVKVVELDLRVSSERLLRTCQAYEGYPYDWISIINIALYGILGRLALNFSGPKALICSEFVARVLYDLSDKKIDFEQVYGKKFDLITPTEIHQWVMKQND